MNILANCRFIQLSKSDENKQQILIYKTKNLLKQAKQKGWQKDDFVFIVERDKKVIGYARFVHVETDHLWLRGLYIDSDFRKHGIATELLQFCHQELRFQIEKITCFPLSHLDRFYQNLNYQFIQAETLPTELHQRFTQASKSGHNWLCMQLQQNLNR